MWIEAISKSISEIEYRELNHLEVVSNLSSDVDWSDDEWVAFNKTASAIVEPFELYFRNGTPSDKVLEEEGFYHEMIDTQGYVQVKSNLPESPHKHKWFKVIELLDKIGY